MDNSIFEEALNELSEKRKYIYTGPVLKFNKPFIGNIRIERFAYSKSQAKNYMLRAIAKDNNLKSPSGLDLDSDKIEVVDVERNDNPTVTAQSVKKESDTKSNNNNDPVQISFFDKEIQNQMKNESMTESDMRRDTVKQYLSIIVRKMNELVGVVKEDDFSDDSIYANYKKLYGDFMDRCDAIIRASKNKNNV